MSSGMTITCGQCGTTSDIDAWTSTPIAGALPRGTYQCPKCRLAFERKQAPGKRYPDGFYMPGPVSLVPVSPRM